MSALISLYAIITYQSKNLVAFCFSASDYIVKRRLTDKSYNSGKYFTDLASDKDSLVMKIKQELKSKDNNMKKVNRNCPITICIFKYILAICTYMHLCTSTNTITFGGKSFKYGRK